MAKRSWLRWYPKKKCKNPGDKKLGKGGNPKVRLVVVRAPCFFNVVMMALLQLGHQKPHDVTLVKGTRVT